jgi:ceramide glucosyltransferase
MIFFMLLAYILLALLVGSWVYCGLTVLAAWRYQQVRPAEAGSLPPMSILKPLAGADDGLPENLASFFEQEYPEFEILFAVREPSDPAVPVVEKLRAQFPGVPSQLIITGEPPYPNAKVYSLDLMMQEARHDLLVMSDSDIRVTPFLLQTLAAEFADPDTMLSTCPYRAVPGSSWWSTLEALGLNSEFLGGVLVARMLDGMKFAIGPTIAARRRALDRIGGFDRLKDYLAEDFVMGQLVSRFCGNVILSSYVIEHRIGSQNWVANLRHRLRWNRGTRRSRPWGYVGQIFTNPLPLALLLWMVHPEWGRLAAVTLLFRAATMIAVSGLVLRDPLTKRLWFLVPAQDCLSFVMWAAGFFGNTIMWRGRRYYLAPDGTFELVD